MGFDGYVEVAEKVEGLSFEDYRKASEVLELYFTQILTAPNQDMDRVKNFTEEQTRAILITFLGGQMMKIPLYLNKHGFYYPFKDVVHLQGNISRPLHEWIVDRMGWVFESGDEKLLSKKDVEKLHAELKRIVEKRDADTVFELEDLSQQERRFFFRRFYALYDALSGLLKEDIENKYVFYTADW